MTATSSKTKLIAGVGAVAVVVVIIVVVLVTQGGSSTSTTSPTAPKTLAVSGSVIDAGYAKKIGFPKTVQAAKQTAVTDQKGCTTSVEAVYEDSGSKTGLISDVLNCGTKSAATAALAVARKHVTLDSSVAVPKELGTGAFATNSDAPEYLLVWQAGTRVAIAAIDVDVSASASSAGKAAAPPLSASQAKALSAAALEQNSLYQ
jgi:hypothetical protein